MLALGPDVAFGTDIAGASIPGPAFGAGPWRPAIAATRPGERLGALQ